MSEERELMKKRGSFKGRLTTFIHYFDALNVKTLNESDVTEIQLRLGKIESLYEQYDEVQTRLECIVEDVQVQFSERSEFESKYYKYLAQAQSLLTKFNKDNNSTNNDKGTHASNHKLVKLPTIRLPKFSGSYETWLEFHDTFTSLIHSNDEIDEINKFHYLRASLEGTAAVVIQSIEFSASNYSVAWQLLCDRFDNKRLLIQNHISALFNVEPIVKESSLTLKRLIDQLNKNLRALESLGEPVKHWDTLLIYIVARKLDQKTFREWEEFKGRRDKDNRIKFEDFISFMHNRADLIETLELSRNNVSNPLVRGSKLKSMVAQSPIISDTDLVTRICPKCKGDHNLNTCPQFLSLSNIDRFKLLPDYKVCYNCFHKGHFANRCKKPACKLCKRKHNTLIHISESKGMFNFRNENTFNNVTDRQSSSSPCTKSDTNNVVLAAHVASCGDTKQCEVLLSTALINLHDRNNRVHTVCAVLDSGSTSSFITERLCKRLNLATSQISRSILGINNVSSHVGKTCRVTMTSLDNSFSADVYCFVLPLITTQVPNYQISISNLNIPSEICLADPMFYKPSDVDILIGADLFWDLLGSHKIKLGDGKPMLCETRLGWIVSGTISNKHVTLFSKNICCNFSNIDSLSVSDMDEIRADLSRFWQLEEILMESSNYSPEERRCEEHFIQNTSRLADGRFCVRIPLKQSTSVLGHSLQGATRCLLSLERRLKANPDLQKIYRQFMSEYELLGHMTECKRELNNSGNFIPHHGVLRRCNANTKFRAVFNASCPTSTGVTFNDIQMVGPTIQDDLLSILLRFRQHKYVLTADVEKMYRQVVVHQADRYLQKILWRDNTSEPFKIYALNTVTYGTASAPFLATRCLRQIGFDCKDNMIAKIIKHDFYVDDMLTGGDELNQVQLIRTEVTKALLSACMPLRKWMSNEPSLVSESESLKCEGSGNLNIGCNEPNKLLGLSWYATSDEFGFSIDSSMTCHGNTKRNLLSIIARIFDPLGLLSPCVIRMKMLLQQMWLDKLSWDDTLPPKISVHWQSIVKDLHLLNNFRIPRIIVCDSYKELELHIFTDASERAYGACVYVRSLNGKNHCMVRLLVAKSRVAPIRLTTIPRLELCGALIGARLYDKVINSLRAKISRVFCWTDSTIVLGWLQMLPCKLQPFVRNRVADILEKTDTCIWRHVPTSMNPADLISRGVDISTLHRLDLWWSGPEFLMDDLSRWPSQVKHFELLPETRPDVSLGAVIDIGTLRGGLVQFERFSNYLRLVRSVAYVLRFVTFCKKQLPAHKFLSEDELKDALNLIILKCQNESFSEYNLLIKKQGLPKSSPLLKFNVYLDENNLMRVGGRLDNSNFPYNKKHPLLLQSTHHFTKILFDHEHKRLMHAGPQLLLASIRENYWPIGGRNLAKACYHKCVRCHRMKGRVVTPLMGNLPRERVLPGGHPFETTGIDYAGPMMCVSRQGRGCRLVKVYIAIFICFTTKAIHLELVGDLTCKTFLLALYRFISRRGRPTDIYSDNGTSFVGAYNELSKFLKTSSDSLSESVANDGIKFHFIPAYTPHFGGLWEAGVKSTKYHLQRVLGNCNLTYEQFNTILIQIEAILNSRPLTPLSSDPADYTPLTPGHFLIGRPLTSISQPNYEDNFTSQLTRFQRIEQLRQHFWSRWNKEYVAELQQRIKWRFCKDMIQLNSLVVIKEENLPPLKWKLGRIVAVHPGTDGVVRVADIQTSTGVLRRAFNRICPLPVVSPS